MDNLDPFATQAYVHPTVAGDLILDGFDDPVEIGRGGFGVVYRCMETALDRTVAIKVLSGVDKETGIASSASNRPWAVSRAIRTS